MRQKTAIAKIVGPFDVIILEKNTESQINAFYTLARKLNHTRLVVLTSDPSYIIPQAPSGLKVLRAILIKDPSQIAKMRNKFDLIFAPAERKFFESKVDFIIDSEDSSRNDSVHYRRTAFNHVHAKLCVQHGSSILFSFRKLLRSGLNSPVAGRMMQNIRVARKYGVPWSVVSFATRPSELRSSITLQACGRTFEAFHKL